MIARQRGQSLAEFVLVTLLVTAVLLIGDPGPLGQLLDAMQQQYARFTHAIALP